MFNTFLSVGLFADYRFEYAEWRREEEPTLVEMTRRSLEFLQARSLRNDPNSNKGYYLFVEGGLIDYGHHYNLGAHALFDTLAFDEAIEVMFDLIDNLVELKSQYFIFEY